ncbi:MAG: zinc metallopeptidase [Candidatus Cloacimonetes bacterium]|nr:zinc metallopeptidase [Candidatus Cloacimonadota bacterium]
MFYWGDFTFFMIIPVFILALSVQYSVNQRYKQYSKVMNRAGFTGAQAARKILDANGLTYVKVEMVKGHLTDHYDPRSQVVRLSALNYLEPSISSVTIAAHECGHALQHAEKYAPLGFRSSILPVANLGSKGAFPLFLLGLFFSITPLMDIGIILFAGALLFHLVTLPVEFNASSRAYVQLRTAGLADEQELVGAHRVLNAAAMTYVASTLMALVQLIRLVILRNRR